MQPFVSVAASLVPELIPLIQGDQAGTLEPTIIRTVTDTTRASTAADARRLLTANDKLAAQLQTRLKKIAAVAEKIQGDDVLLLSDDWAAPASHGGIAGPGRQADQAAAEPPPQAKPSPTEAALELRKLLLKERVLDLREAQFEREISRRWIHEPAIIISLILGVAALCTALVITTKDIQQANAAKAAALANEQAAEKLLAAAQINQAAARAAKLTANPSPRPVAAKPAMAPIIAPSPPTAAQLQQAQLEKFLSQDPHAAFTCTQATAATRLKTAQTQFPTGQPRLAAFYLTNAATCAPPDHKLTTTQSFYAAAARAAAPLPVTTIFIQYTEPAQAPIATALAAKLAQNPGYFVPPPQQASPAIAPRRAEANYYTSADAPIATAITILASTIPTMPPAKPNYFQESLRNIPQGVIEIWFPRG